MGMSHRIGVLAPAELLQALDLQLWTFSAHDFLPHARLHTHADQNSSLIQRSSIWLVESTDVLSADHVVLHLGHQVPDGFQRFMRWIELVGLDENEQRNGRARWKHYRDRGYTLIHHDHQK